MKDKTIDYVLRATWQAVSRMYNEEAAKYDATMATDGMSALLKLAEVADALRQRPGPTREQAPPPRRTR